MFWGEKSPKFQNKEILTLLEQRAPELSSLVGLPSWSGYAATYVPLLNKRLEVKKQKYYYLVFHQQFFYLDLPKSEKKQPVFFNK